jgi:ribosome biogenesis GTPase A
MEKGRRRTEAELKWVNVVLEVCDARLPVRSRSPLLATMLAGKKRLLLLNKCDLADEKATAAWVKHCQKEGKVLPISVASGRGLADIVPSLEKITKEEQAKDARRGLRPKSIRVMVVGIPNIGKSSLINRLVGSARTKTGNKPGVTRGTQWVRVHERIDLLDTPGLLWPKFDDQETGRALAATGAIRDEVFAIEELASWLIERLRASYPESLRRYGEPSELDLAKIGRKRGCLQSGNTVDHLRAAHIFLKEFREGRLGGITLDALPALEQSTEGAQHGLAD